MSMNQNQFRTWNEVRKELFTPEEIAESGVIATVIFLTRMMIVSARKQIFQPN